MQFQKKLLLLLLAVFSVISCDPKDDVDPTVEAVQNISFQKIMEPSPFAGAKSISVSPNEKYMLFVYQENTQIKHYYSKDGGQTVQELKTSAKIVESNISNTGLMVTGDGGIYDLENNRNGSGNLGSATGVTDSGQLIYIQNDGANGKTFFIENNGTYVSTGVQLTMDEDFYLGTSGEKMGFFDWRNRIIAEFDVSTKTYTQTTLTEMNYSRLYGAGNSRTKVKTAYSYGHFAYAKEGGVIMVTPEKEIRYYDYPDDYRIWQNTEGGMKLYKDHAYVNIFDRWGNQKVHVVTGNSVEPVDHDFAVCLVGDVLYTQGFIENSDRFRGGIIKTENGQQEYLPLDMAYQYQSDYMFGKTYVIGDYAYAEDKVFDVNSGTYATSPTGSITSILHDGGRTIAYTESGIYSTVNGKDWNLESDSALAPELITKGTDGKYHALNLTQQVYISPGTQAKTYSVDINGYVSNDGINWTSVPEASRNISGTGPRFMSSDGKVYSVDNNVGKIPVAYFSEDFGVTWVRFVNGENTATGEAVPSTFKTSEFETSNGKFLSVQFEFNGQMFLNACSTSTGDCTEIEIEPNFNTESMYQFDDRTTTLSSNDELVFNTLDGIYISSSLK